MFLSACHRSDLNYDCFHGIIVLWYYQYLIGGVSRDLFVAKWFASGFAIDGVNRVQFILEV